jgi:uncharacterized protein YdeI (BOF family)
MKQFAVAAFVLILFSAPAFASQPKYLQASHTTNPHPKHQKKYKVKKYKMKKSKSPRVVRHTVI